MIEAQNLHKRFGPVTVLNNVSFRIKEGKLVAVLGPNGSGKTTILKIILGMILPQGGNVLLRDQSILDNWEHRRDIGYLPQIARFPDNLRVSEVIHMIKDIRNAASREDELIEVFGVQKYLDKKLGNLSGGTRQKVNIILTFMFDSPVIILDEPTAGLDPRSMVKLKILIEEEKQKGKTILVTTHIMPLVEEIADEVIFLLEGNIYFQGAISDLKRRTGQQNLERAIAKILEDNDQDHQV